MKRRARGPFFKVLVGVYPMDNSGERGEDGSTYQTLRHH